MEESKVVYVLQKDLPDSKAGDEYISDGTGNGRPIYYKNGNKDASYWLAESVENNPTWWLLKEKVKPIVVDWGEVEVYGKNDHLFFMVEDKNLKVDSLHEYKISKVRLAEILIAIDVYRSLCKSTSISL